MRPPNEEEKLPSTEACSNRSKTWPEPVPALAMGNVGVASIYHDWPLAYRLRSARVVSDLDGHDSPLSVDLKDSKTP